MMENRISDTDERKMTNAIESAATLSSNDASRDRSETLAGQLKEAGVDSRFAKVATAAFNKRLTVMTFKKTADDHKADPFELADADKVLELMTGESLEKAASAEASFEITYSDNSPSMQKVAAEKQTTPSRLPYEDTVRYETLMTHIEGVMEKNAAALQDLMYALDDSERKADAMSSELADYFMKSACASFEFDTLVNAYGDRFKNAIGHKLPAETEFTKTASGAILTDTVINRKAAELVETQETVDALKQSLKYYGEGLNQFCKAAADLGDYVQDLEMKLTKQALDDNGLGREYASEIGMLLPAGIRSTTNFATGLVNDITDAAKNSLGNAYTLYRAGNSAHMAPHEILDAEFLTKDRYRDRLLGWSDMTADPQFAMYPAEQVFLATQKAMDMDTTLERPDRREVLRSYVAQLLAQNNRMSTADVAALAQTLRGLSDADKSGNAGRIALSVVRGLEEKKAPEIPELRQLLKDKKDSGEKEDVWADIEKSQKAYEDRVAAKNKDKQQDKELNETTKREKAKALAEAIAARNQFLTNTMGIQIGMGPKGKLTYTPAGATKSLTDKELAALFENAEKANVIPILPA